MKNMQEKKNTMFQFHSSNILFQACWWTWIWSNITFEKTFVFYVLHSEVLHWIYSTAKCHFGKTGSIHPNEKPWVTSSAAFSLDIRAICVTISTPHLHRVQWGLFSSQNSKAGNRGRMSLIPKTNTGQQGKSVLTSYNTITAIFNPLITLNVVDCLR